MHNKIFCSYARHAKILSAGISSICRALKFSHNAANGQNRKLCKGLNYFDHPQENCGIFGIAGLSDAAWQTYLGLYALQHRGEESAGIAFTDNDKILLYKGMGLVADVFDMRQIKELSAKNAIGHVRYSTTGRSNLVNAQPFVNGSFALAHNGNIINADILKAELEKDGSVFQTTMDSEVFLHLLAKNLKYGFESALQRSGDSIQGAFSFIILTRDGKLVGMKDGNGLRPLCLGKKGDNYLLASETCALDIIEADFVREIEAGEIVIIENNRIKSIKREKKKDKTFCIFEFIYFARADSILFDRTVYQTRKAFGKYLANESPVNADLVMPLPDSGTCAALGFAEALNLPFELAMIRNQYIGRTFIQPFQSMRDLGVQIKLNPVKEILKGKEIVIVEDSIIRGTTIKMIVKTLRKIGVKKIHFKVASPMHLFPCNYGINFSTTGELFAAGKSIDELKDFLEIDSLYYLSLKGLLEASGIPNPKKNFCKACLDGVYPTD